MDEAKTIGQQLTTLVFDTFIKLARLGRREEEQTLAPLWIDCEPELAEGRSASCGCHTVAIGVAMCESVLGGTRRDRSAPPTQPHRNRS